MKAWFRINELRSKVGIITDFYLNYIELKDIDTGLYHIIHEDEVELIENNEQK